MIDREKTQAATAVRRPLVRRLKPGLPARILRSSRSRPGSASKHKAYVALKNAIVAMDVNHSHEDRPHRGGRRRSPGCDRDAAAAAARPYNPSHCRSTAQCGRRRSSCRSRWSRCSSRHRLPGVDDAARGADAVRASEELQDARRCAACRGRELVLGNVDDPVAAADRDAGNAGGVLSFEPALRCCDTSRIGGKDGRSDANRGREGGGAGTACDRLRQQGQQWRWFPQPGSDGRRKSRWPVRHACVTSRSPHPCCRKMRRFCDLRVLRTGKTRVGGDPGDIA